jgi:hypothetical protein
MKTHTIEVQKIKQMIHSNGLIRAQIDALVQPTPARDDSGAMPSSILSFTEGTARVLMLLLKTQLAELDARKAKSRR